MTQIPPKTPPTPPTKMTKSDIAKLYGFTWRAFKGHILAVIPALKGTRRQFLHPKEVEQIFNELGKPSEFNP